MEGKFTHYLITRFNVPVKNWNKDKAGHQVLDAAWMEHRLDLFRQYCVPTVRRQSGVSFSWLIYCDVFTDEIALQNIRQCLSTVPHAMIRQVTDFDHLLLDVRELIQGAEVPYVITTRLDNDDGLGPDFIRDVQAHFKTSNKVILNFTRGILYDADRKVLTEVRSSPRNHYASLIEKVDPHQSPLTALGYPHGIPPEDCTIENIETRYSWLKVIHQRNMASKTNGWPLFRNTIAKHFGLDPSLFNISLPATLWFAFRRFVSKIRRKLFPKKS
jgi:hypothetical protein